jgi:hypothetical protein
MTLREYTKTEETYAELKLRLRKAGVDIFDKDARIDANYKKEKNAILAGVKFTCTSAAHVNKAVAALEGLGYDRTKFERSKEGVHPKVLTVPVLEYSKPFKFVLGRGYRMPDNYGGYGSTLANGTVYYVTGVRDNFVYVTTKPFLDNDEDADAVADRAKKQRPLGTVCSYKEGQALALLTAYRLSGLGATNFEAWELILKDHPSLFKK